MKLIAINRIKSGGRYTEPGQPITVNNQKDVERLLITKAARLATEPVQDAPVQNAPGKKPASAAKPVQNAPVQNTPDKNPESAAEPAAEKGAENPVPEEDDESTGPGLINPIINDQVDEDSTGATMADVGDGDDSDGTGETAREDSPGHPVGRFPYQIDGIGNDTIEVLCEAGFTTLESLKSVTTEQLVALPKVGYSKAKKILRAVKGEE